MSRALEWATVANLFTEPSTRTRVSFELAAKRLGAQVVNLEVQLSSRVKGESMLDTVYTLAVAARGRVRDPRCGGGRARAGGRARRPARERAVGRGGARVAPHPGICSMRSRSSSTSSASRGLTVAIVGDIRHSRVARSAWHAFAHARGRRAAHRRPAGAHAAPGANSPAARATRASPTALEGADVIMMLRIQKERMSEARPARGRALLRQLRPDARAARAGAGRMPSSCIRSR